jgi:DNA repair exonuclease SbcCD ATPase subunit
MIVFKKITYKNFLSTGNVANTILLDKSVSTLIVGKNGEGKSTVLDAITFVLFGKPFRNINKPQLVNSINGKNCLVDIEFQIGTSQYKISRGLKPNIFEIWCDGVLFNQDAAAKDYQKILEQQILKLNYKSFTQVVILGSASFVPFMQLPAAQRRAVIEDILDISVFSTMNTILKERINDTKDLIKTIENKIEGAKNNVEAQKKLIGTMVNSKKDQVDQIRKQIKDNEEEIKINETRWEDLNDKVNSLLVASENSPELEKLINSAVKAKTLFTQTIENNDKTIGFFNKNETCPSCSQGIPHEHKASIVQTLSTDQINLENNIKIVEDAYEKLIERQKSQDIINKQLTSINIECNAINMSVSNLIKQNKKLNEDISTAESNTDNIDAEKQRLKDIAGEALKLIETKNQLFEDKHVQEIASLLLKDTGVKTAIIREYLPVMNKLINGYLSAMDFYIHFELDESFNEVIKSRFRDEFTYASFSEGEKMRIDLAILFTWRSIAKMKNSVNTNLLILDEIFDSSLDVSGTDYFLSIMNAPNDKSNIFVISHKGDQLFDKFHSVIRVEKKNDFSTIV